MKYEASNMKHGLAEAYCGMRVDPMFRDLISREND
jgi:hypothetical protein